MANSQLLPTEMLTTKPKNLFAKRGKGDNGVECLKSLEWSRAEEIEQYLNQP